MDPRIHEIELLAMVEKRGPIHMDFTKAPFHPEETGQPERDLVVYSIREGHLEEANSGSTLAQKARAFLTPGYGASREFDVRALELIVLLHEQRSRDLRLTHKGRVRLWTLRDQLQSFRRREQFGVLWAGEHCETDWRLAMAFREVDDPVSLLICDLDRFKKVNDNLGHPVGDRALVNYFETVKEQVKGFGEAYRLGGDEVVLLLPKLDAVKCGQLGERIRGCVAHALGSMKELDKLPVQDRPTVSIGTFTTLSSDGWIEAYTAADDALKAAKDGGKDRVVAAGGSS